MSVRFRISLAGSWIAEVNSFWNPLEILRNSL